ncbi:hypothetical protein F4556_003830 [Kitasatospora gansuensis]|uniref:Uncharacterized protein n=1 Tax=Kitasatospora gansuensis TaxID=258050 RepID=A0A7W7SD50_9ACTN|nr:hypothetical protein [Kitasatospora gansuensis]
MRPDAWHFGWALLLCAVAAGARYALRNRTEELG